MLNKKAQTIQGFLTPTKLLSGMTKSNKQNSKGPKSPINNKAQLFNSRFNSQNQSILNTSKDIQSRAFQIGQNINNSRLTGDMQKYETNKNNQKKYQSQRNITTSFLEKEIYKYSNKKNSIPILQEDQYYPNKQRTLQEINNRKWDMNRNNNQPYVSIRPNYQNQNVASLPIKSINKNSQNPQLMTVQCYQLIRKLSKVKQNLELQIAQLQNLLDHTSKYMENMQEQFQKIKLNILIYTSRCLDNAFTQYKQNMVDWQKYQDFQRKSKIMVTQINQYIYNQQQKLQEDSKNHSYRQMTLQAQQIQKKIKFYNTFTQQVKEIREQCLSMRPTITEQKLRQYEKGVQILCNF